jgi:hypothetical protein
MANAFFKGQKIYFIVIYDFIKSYFLAMKDCMTRNRFLFKDGITQYIL